MSAGMNVAVLIVASVPVVTAVVALALVADFRRRLLGEGTSETREEPRESA